MRDFLFLMGIALLAGWFVYELGAIGWRNYQLAVHGKNLVHRVCESSQEPEIKTLCNELRVIYRGEMR